MQPPASSSSRQTLLAIAILVCGIVIGKFLPTATPSTQANLATPAHSNSPAGTEVTASANDLPTIHVSFSEEVGNALKVAREQAAARLVAIESDKAWHPASIQVDGNTYPASIRLKGDLADHMKTDKWSLRIRLNEGTLFGMRVFSIQHPAARGNLWEWLSHEAARHDGLLSPRSSFVNVALNGKANGIYYLEEHFSKELLESQKRREGPIVRLADTTYWSVQIQHHLRTFSNPGISESALSALKPDRSMPLAYEEKQLQKVDALNRQLAQALENMDTLQHQYLRSSSPTTKQALRKAIRTEKGKTLERIMDVPQLARFHSLLTLFQAGHPMIWFNQRYYYNPVTTRLEPIAFDVNAHDTQYLDDLIPLDNRAYMFAMSTSYLIHFYDLIPEYASPAYLDELYDRTKTEGTRFEQALLAENLLPDDHRFEALFNRLRARQAWIRATLSPSVAAGFAGTMITKPDSPREILVEAWNTTQVPVTVHGFAFSNGRNVSAAETVATNQAPALTQKGTVILPSDGTRVQFRFPADQRLAGLQDVKAIKDAIRSDSETTSPADIELSAIYNTLPEHITRTNPLTLRHRSGHWDNEGGRPIAPALPELIDAHPFLAFDVDHDHLFIRPGDWTLTNDFVVPSGHTLHMSEGTRLKFAPGTAFISEAPIQFHGSETSSVTLTSLSTTQHWDGLIVLNAQHQSYLSHVNITHTRGIQRGGWMTTGGTTFFKSSVTLSNCTIDVTRAEDALNVIDAHIVMQNTKVSNTASDAFDGDFVTGSIINSLFSHTGSDAIDTSGSQILVQGTALNAIGDKAFSIGERSHARLIDNHINGAMIGIASKDASSVTAARIRFQNISGYPIAVYVKKPEYGPAQVDAKNLEFPEGSPKPSLSQSGNRLVIDGQPVATEEVDVDNLYRTGVLGK